MQLTWFLSVNSKEMLPKFRLLIVNSIFLRHVTDDNRCTRLQNVPNINYSFLCTFLAIKLSPLEIVTRKYNSLIKTVY